MVMGMVGQKKSFAARRAYLQTKPDHPINAMQCEALFGIGPVTPFQSINQSTQSEALFGIGPVEMACGARANVSGPGSL